MQHATQLQGENAHGLGFSIRFVSANLRVFFILPMSAQISCRLLPS